ncbi:hypothetical protein HRbin36_02117 [bacterium HR36]|nr:hypothetical protein HRbin36_02117 [bacterium HR36]
MALDFARALNWFAAQSLRHHACNWFVYRVHIPKGRSTGGRSHAALTSLALMKNELAAFSLRRAFHSLQKR